MKIIFMGTPDFAVPCLRKLIGSEHELVAVYTAAPKPAGRGKQLRKSAVHILAEENGLKVLTPKSLKEENLPECDAAVVAAYGMLLPKHILESPKYGCLNIHPSDLPRWRGAAPIQRTIMAGDKKSAVCVMQMDEYLDTGDVLVRQDLLVPDDMTAGQLHDICADLGGELVLEVLNRIGEITPQKQSDLGVTYATKITREDEKINWGKTAEEVKNQIRGLNPFPGAFFEYDGQKIKVFECEIADAKGEAGRVLDDELLVACGQKAIRITNLQKPGKRPMSAEDFLRGNVILKNASI